MEKLPLIFKITKILPFDQIILLPILFFFLVHNRDEKIIKMEIRLTIIAVIHGS